MVEGAVLGDRLVSSTPIAPPTPCSGSGPRGRRVPGQGLPRSPFDTYTANNAVESFLRVEGEPRILHVTTTPVEATPLAALAREAGLGLRSIAPEELPSGVAALAPYVALVLEDVPAPDLSDEVLTSIRSYVRDLGGGLIMLGSEGAFGPGGYHETPVEEALPSPARSRTSATGAPVSLVVAIDKSGSMAGATAARRPRSTWPRRRRSAC